MAERAAVILAAGRGTRMRSPVPKVLHGVGRRTLVDRAIDAAQAAGCGRIVVVVGAHAPEVGMHVERRLGSGSTAVQDPPLGTAHAVRAAEAALQGFDGEVLVTTADAPLLDETCATPLFEALDGGARLAVLGARAADAGAYGRLVLAADGGLDRIVEAKEATPEELAITAWNSGVLAARWTDLQSWLARVGRENAKGEYYLTDVVGLARADRARVAVAFADGALVEGVNSQAELAAAEGRFQAARRSAALEAGVAMPAPDTVHFAWDTELASGCTVEPYVVFAAGVSVAAGAVIRSFSHLEGASVSEGALVGPYARLRPGAVIGAQAHIGNFVEVKNVAVGAGAKANHLAYLGDGAVGAKANIGAGTIFCNYDGFTKARTEVGEGAFVGSNSALVAPVRIGAGAYVGSGSVIVRDVPDDALALERGGQVEKPGWAAAFRARHAKPSR